MAGARGSSCSIPSCDAKVMSDERGNDILSCGYGFKIYMDCYLDVVKTSGGICPECKEPYKAQDLGELGAVNDGRSQMSRQVGMGLGTSMESTRKRLSDFAEGLASLSTPPPVIVSPARAACCCLFSLAAARHASAALTPLALFAATLADHPPIRSTPVARALRLAAFATRFPHRLHICIPAIAVTLAAHSAAQPLLAAY
ncbi:hypothetical protein Scep_025260 [Stephania cephalantha]|uniref:Uncharacterized protein n=1 Tax=Stephania cephalantha TaxID=152367 RepID=A0AAP0EHY1_9MAGN